MKKYQTCTENRGRGKSCRFIVSNQNYYDMKTIQTLQEQTLQTNIVHQHKRLQGIHLEINKRKTINPQQNISNQKY